ncbi:MAG: 60S ribosomal export protein NMD3 [Candidatus Marsarchaeota archaeon]|nr:60S ribosomal export protein NMD3 [Candidatus Marsarchaeota archaeon]
MKYCPTCNRNSNENRFIGEFCETCTIKKINAEVSESAEITQCKDCGKIKTNQGYAKLDKLSLSAILQKLLKKSFVKIKAVDFDKSIINAQFSIFKNGEKVRFEKHILFSIKKSMCDQCYRRHSGYYEALVQLRVSGNEFHEKEMSRLEKIASNLTKYIEAGNGFITKIEKSKNGLDVYTSDKKATSAFMSLRKFKPKVSFTLYGLKNGKKVYRNIYLLKP